MKKSVLAAVALALCSLAARCADTAVVSAEERIQWVRYTVPLPKAIEINQKVTLPKGAVRIVPPAEKDIIAEQAVKELTALVGAAKPDAVFSIVMQLGGEDARPLESLKNCGQAYRIFPAGQDTIKLVALRPPGLYYAAKTLQQLIAARAAADRLEIPLAVVTDWPDLEDRGLWGSDNHENVEWLADRKMNWMEQISNQFVDMKTGKPVALIKDGREPLLYEAPQRAIKFVPVVLHLEQSSGKGPIAYYPYIKGKSEHHGVMCYSQPKTVEIISSWIEQLASLPHVEEVDVWMSENLGQKIGCQCKLCKAKKVNPMVLEARAIVQAWRDAQKRLGRQFGLRILTSEATEDYNTIIFSELPKEVKVVYYHSLGTYTCDKRPMMKQYLIDFAKSGRWVATCPNISAIVGYVQPFESAQFVRYRAFELVRNQASGILAYATPRVKVCRYNVEALAEYTWNVRGRSTREFAYSWAVRNGIKDPEKFADFRELIGPIEWRFNGGDWPMRATHRRLVPPLEQMLKQGKLPGFGYYIDGFVKCPFGAYANASQLKSDLENSAKALRMAKELGIEEFIQESRVTQGYITALNALYDLQSVIKNQKVAPEDRAEAARLFQAYVDGFRQAIDALTRWHAVFFPPSPGEEPGRPKPADESQMLVDRMLALARELGVEVK